MNKIQLYEKQYFVDCLNLFKSNTPKFFDPSEEELLQKYLNQESINYYLFFDEKNKLVATGGYEHEQPSKIVLTWGMVDKKLHNNGYGRYITEYRLKKINEEFPNTDVILNTSQHTFKFYEKFRFKVIKITKNGYGFGLDKYDMILTE